MGRTLLAAVLSLFVVTVPVFAADPADGVEKTVVLAAATPAMSSLATAITAEAARVASAAAPAAAPVGYDWWNSQHRRPAALPALYASSALLQAYDAYSTMKALRLGATEANPLMKSATSNPMVFVGIKAAVATASIMSAERMWKDGHRTGAVLTMIVSNGFMAWVAAHNAGVVNGLQR